MQSGHCVWLMDKSSLRHLTCSRTSCSHYLRLPRVNPDSPRGVVALSRLLVGKSSRSSPLRRAGPHRAPSPDECGIRRYGSLGSLRTTEDSWNRPSRKSRPRSRPTQKQRLMSSLMRGVDEPRVKAQKPKAAG